IPTRAAALGQASPWLVSRAGVCLVLDATERCVYVRIMRLEPVAERTAQHARGRARRAAFRHVVPAVEKICGIARIKGHRREPRERRELRARPLPSVSDKIINAKRACPRGMRAHGRGIP